MNDLMKFWLISTMLTTGVRFDAAIYIDTLYAAVDNVLCAGANAYVPRAKKNFYKFW